MRDVPRATREAFGRALRLARTRAGFSVTAEDPREVVEPAPAPAPAQRFVCLKCGWSGPQSDTYTYPAANSTRWHMGCPYAVVPAADAQPAGAADGEAGS